MKALLLVGGYGTRLRPVTLTIPKPLVQFCNKSILEYQIGALVKIGVDHVILAVSCKQEAIINKLAELEKKYDIRIECSVENEPLGTAGPIRNAEKLLTNDGQITDPNTPFFVFNSDIICDFPLSEMLKLHSQHKGRGTILITMVSDPSKFGVVKFDEKTHLIHEFLEKPQMHTEAAANAGIYILNLSIIKQIPLQETSIERVTFPHMVKNKELYAFKNSGLWMDVGNPQDYLSGMISFLNNPDNTELQDRLSIGSNIVGNVIIDSSAKIDPNCLIGPNVTIGPQCIVREGARIQNCAIFQKVTIFENTFIKNAIISDSCQIHRWSRVEGLTVLGENVVINKEVFIRSASILPHKVLSENIYDAGRIVM